MTDTSSQSVAGRLHADLQHAGYYPELVEDVLEVTLAGEHVTAHLVHPETTFHGVQVHRHVTVLVLTPSRLIIAHVDDYVDENGEQSHASATTETVPLAKITTVSLTHVVDDPETYRAGMSPQELTLAVAWGAVRRMDVEPAVCPDPNCDADHGLTGAITPDDLFVRVSAKAEGVAAVESARTFARTLSAAIAQYR